MTATPTNYLSQKLPFPLLRAGIVRWYEALNTAFYLIVWLFSSQILRIAYGIGPFSNTAYKGNLATYDTGIVSGNLDNMVPVDAGTSGEEYPLVILDRAESTGTPLPFWWGKTIGYVEFENAHGITPGTVGYRNDASPGLITTSGTLIVGVYMQDKGFLFLPHNT